MIRARARASSLSPLEIIVYDHLLDVLPEAEHNIVNLHEAPDFFNRPSPFRILKILIRAAPLFAFLRIALKIIIVVPSLPALNRETTITPIRIRAGKIRTILRFFPLRRIARWNIHIFNPSFWVVGLVSSFPSRLRGPRVSYA